MPATIPATLINVITQREYKLIRTDTTVGSLSIPYHKRSLPKMSCPADVRIHALIFLM